MGLFHVYQRLFQFILPLRVFLITLLFLVTFILIFLNGSLDVRQFVFVDVLQELF